MRFKTWADVQWDYCCHCWQKKVPHPKYATDPLSDGWEVCPSETINFTQTGKLGWCPHPTMLIAPFVHGAYYFGMCRNAQIARYNADIDKFIYWRQKFGNVYAEEIGHAGNDNGFDLFRPYGTLTVLPEGFKEIPLVLEWRTRG
jgi:hypothetical protein